MSILNPADASSVLRWFKAQAESLSDGDPVTSITGIGPAVSNRTMDNGGNPARSLSFRASGLDGFAEYVWGSASNLSGYGLSTGTEKVLYIVATLPPGTTEYNLWTEGSGIWREAADGRGNMGAMRNQRIEEYSEAMPTSGSHFFVLVSTDTEYRLYVDGALMGIAPGDFHDTFCNWALPDGASVSEMLQQDVFIESEMLGLMEYFFDRYPSLTLGTNENVEFGQWVYPEALAFRADHEWETAERTGNDCIQEQCVIQVSPTRYELTYTGGWGDGVVVDSRPAGIGWGVSPDGITWTRNALPIIGGPSAGAGFAGDARRSNLVNRGGSNRTIFFQSGGAGGEWYRSDSSDAGATWSTPIKVLTFADSPTGDGFANSGTVIIAGVWHTLIECSVSGSWQIYQMTSEDGWMWSEPVGPLTKLQRGVGMFGGPSLSVVGDRLHVFYHASFTGLFQTEIFHGSIAIADFADIEQWVPTPNWSLRMIDDPLTSELHGAVDQYDDPMVVFSLDGETSTIYFTHKCNGQDESQPLRATLPGQFGPPPTFPPTVESAAIDAAGTTLTLVFSQSVTGVDASDYQLSGRTLSSATGAGDTWTFTISPAVYDGDVRTLSYDGTATLGTDDVPLEVFSGAAVTNNSTQVAPTGTSRQSSYALGLGLGFNF